LRRVNGGEISETVIQVAQSALRVADLLFTMRTRAVETVADEISDWLTEKAIPFERSVAHPGRSGRVWTIDYQTRLLQRTSLVFLLATGSRAAARRVTEHVVAGLYDLSHLKLVQPQLSFVSLFDDTEDVWREEDFRLVEDLSSVARWSRPDEFEAMLRAA
jgi:dihydroneopterin aldolase